MQPGERVAGRFEIIGEAARGGMGTVFRARDRRDRRDVALKVLRVEALENVARFEREAALLAALQHPNIVAYISHGATPDGLRYLVMEWVEGETLAHRLAHGGLTGPAIVAMAIQLCRALGALHDRDVVHRDLKPSNVMLVGGDAAQVKLVDLGIARRTADASRLTRTGVVVGTAGYLAPELVRGRSAVLDGRADLFALGCVLHECFTGTAVFRGDSTLAVYAKVLLHDPPPLRALDPSTPPELDALVSALLARRPDQRPASAAAVERALTELGTLPAGVHRAGDARGRSAGRDARPDAAPTLDSHGRRVCGVLVARADDRPWVLPSVDAAEVTVAPFDHGLAVIVDGGLVVAVRLALAVAAASPGVQVVVAQGALPDDCIDRCARALADLEIATQVSDLHGGAGVWIERGAIAELAGVFRLDMSGGHARIVGEVTEATEVTETA
jgi:tRNA A-37 threonylcarbamoyl transferase component Bud32